MEKLKYFVKYFEVRDEGTCIPVMVINNNARNERERLILKRAGLYDDYNRLLFVDLTTNKATRDYFTWRSGGRTLFEAHKYIKENWNFLKSGDIIDVRVILGEQEEAAETDL